MRSPHPFSPSEVVGTSVELPYRFLLGESMDRFWDLWDEVCSRSFYWRGANLEPQNYYNDTVACFFGVFLDSAWFQYIPCNEEAFCITPGFAVEERATRETSDQCPSCPSTLLNLKLFLFLIGLCSRFGGHNALLILPKANLVDIAPTSHWMHIFWFSVCSQQFCTFDDFLEVCHSITIFGIHRLMPITTLTFVFSIH